MVRNARIKSRDLERFAGVLARELAGALVPVIGYRPEITGAVAPLAEKPPRPVNVAQAILREMWPADAPVDDIIARMMAEVPDGPKWTRNRHFMCQEAARLGIKRTNLSAFQSAGGQKARQAEQRASGTADLVTLRQARDDLKLAFDAEVRETARLRAQIAEMTQNAGALPDPQMAQRVTDLEGQMALADREVERLTNERAEMIRSHEAQVRTLRLQLSRRPEGGATVPDIATATDLPASGLPGAESGGLSPLALEFGPYVRGLVERGLSDTEGAKTINRDLGTERMNAMVFCAIKRELGLRPVTVQKRESAA